MQLFPSQPPRNPDVRLVSCLPPPQSCLEHFKTQRRKLEAEWVGSGLRGGEQMIQEMVSAERRFCSQGRCLPDLQLRGEAGEAAG